MWDASPTEERTGMSGAPTAQFMSERRQQLLTLIAELEQLTKDTADSVAAVTLDQTKVGRLSRMDALQGQALAKETRRLREQTIALARIAITRLDAGEYGDCEECGEWINPKRLEMDPVTRHCIECATKAEAN